MLVIKSSMVPGAGSENCCSCLPAASACDTVAESPASQEAPRRSRFEEVGVT
jgi:hypothetical protein